MTTIQTEEMRLSGFKARSLSIWVGRGLHGMGMGASWERDGIAV